MLHVETVNPDTLLLLKQIQSLGVLSETRLVGGTALALHLGHRCSIDLDFFGSWGETNLQPELESCGTVIRTGGTHRMQFYEVNTIKVDFVTYTYAWVQEASIIDGVRLAHIEDIAAMKLEAITNRGSKKDFIDVAVLLEHFSLKQMLELYHRKYPMGLKLHVMRSLVYFEDAEGTDTPVMLKPLTWEAAKERICDAVRATA
ncbi:MAG: nucleotidyl transferase AbiEii/AbiGii toxin family protein [bacterium]